MLKLQRVQNCFATLVPRADRNAPSTLLRHSLHWLPISFRIQFKILTLTYKTLSSGKPSYLANLIHLATPNRNLRFERGPLLVLSALKCKTKTGTSFQRLCTFSLEQSSPVYSLFWIPDLFSATSENTPFWPSVSSLVSWLRDLLMYTAFIWKYVFCLMLFGLKRLWTRPRWAYRRYRSSQYCIVLYCIVLYCIV